MMNLKNWLPAICMLVPLIFSITALYLPWWSIRTSTTLQITSNTTRTADYMPLQTVVASEVGKNKSVTVSFKDLQENDIEKNDLASLFNTTLIVSAVGTVLTASAFTLTLISVLRKTSFSYTWILATVGAIFLLIAPLYLAAEAPSVLGRFASVIPPDISVLPGSQITSFWGANQSWMWGAGIGWFLQFTASLLGISGAVLVRGLFRKTETAT